MQPGSLSCTLCLFWVDSVYISSLLPLLGCLVHDVLRACLCSSLADLSWSVYDFALVVCELHIQSSWKCYRLPACEIWIARYSNQIESNGSFGGRSLAIWNCTLKYTLAWTVGNEWGRLGKQLDVWMEGLLACLVALLLATRLYTWGRGRRYHYGTVGEDMGY